jgi:methionyl-tRNA formyltransferase
MTIGAELTVKTINAIFSNAVKPRDQQTLSTEGSLRPAPKIFRDDCRINWEKPVHDVYNFIRGLDPSPGAWTLMQLNGGDLVVKIFSCRPVESTHDKPAGTIVKEGEGLMVAAAGGYLNILSLQLEGKKKMQTEDFLRGFKDAGSGKFH